MTRDELFQTPLREERVEVRGSTLVVREMTVDELEVWRRKAFDLDAETPEPRPSYRAELLIASVKQEDGAPFFQAEDVPAIGRLPASVVEPLTIAAHRVNGFDRTAPEKN